ncbi:hemerythrin domain-containing protein [Streptomyces sp. FH025]|uniref:hemerythrin domain-containing protein n=1 Tax=Streptomyces sp. FH025 TaxID=2815937 RepID=UPI0027DB6476|nr:hemerythrin domain-containing protein [Streptomyces sp. FH025]
MASPDDGRTAALSLQLARSHRELRRRLADVRTGLGRRRIADDELLTHRLAFCTALTVHHRGEDEGLFTALVRERPDLAPTIAKLTEDHALIASILTRVRELAEQAVEAPKADREAIGRELDGLAAIMESHFGYEERVIGAALDAGVPDDGWSRPVLRLGAP